jgi:hypothetical protein
MVTLPYFENFDLVKICCLIECLLPQKRILLKILPYYISLKNKLDVVILFGITNSYLYCL